MANTPFERYIVVEFACRHRREFTVKHNVPAIGESLYCLRCRRDTTVVKHLKEYRIRCSDCRYSRPFGANRLQAEIAASKHHNRFPNHLVTMWEGVDKAHEWARNDQKLFTKNLPRKAVDTLDLPPF